MLYILHGCKIQYVRLYRMYCSAPSVTTLESARSRSN